MGIDDFYVTKTEFKEEFIDGLMDDVYGQFSSLPSKWERNGFSIDHVMRWAIKNAMNKISACNTRKVTK